MVIPLLVVQISERKLLIATLSISGLLLVFLDLIFNSLGVGYYDLVHLDHQYYFMANFYCLTSYAFILLCLLFEKNLSDKAVHENEKLVSFLQEVNEKLEFKKNEMAVQNHEFTAQSEKLMVNQRSLSRPTRSLKIKKKASLRFNRGYKQNFLPGIRN